MKTILALALVATAAAKTDGDGWTLLVKQDSSKGDFFLRTELADGEYNIDHPEDKLYANLDVDYSKFKSTDGKMTLQLRWPTIASVDKTLTWRQSSSPLAAHGKVTGYEIERNQAHDWNGIADDFNGIAKSASSSTLLDGQTTHGSWWYAVGSHVGYQTAYGTTGPGIPGPLGTGTSVAASRVVNHVELWVKKSPPPPPSTKVAVTKTDAAGWTLLVKQDSSKGDFFPQTRIAHGEYNIEHPEDKLYANLDVDYSKFKSTDGKMTLQLRWPTIASVDKTLTWRQSSSPLAAHGKVTGYEIERNQAHDWNGIADDFNGIAQSASSSTLLDGQTTHGNWWYAVGSHVGYQTAYGTTGPGIPGPLGTGTTVNAARIVNHVELWVKTVRSNARNCADWNCQEWCTYFNVADESVGIYADNGCDDGTDNECKC